VKSVIKKNKGYKFRLKPSKEQIVYLEKAFGCSRKMYNLYVDILYRQLEELNFENGKINYNSIELPTPASIKKDYEYMKEIDSLAFANVQLDFRAAIKKYNSEYDGKTYSKKAKKQVKTLGKELTFKDLKGIPTFKSRRKNQNSFTTNNQNGTIAIIDERFVKIPKLKEPIKFVNHRKIPQNCIIKSAAISKNCKNNYYISFTVEYYIEEKQTPSKNILGLDYSQHDFFVDSEGRKANYPKYYRKLENKLKEEYKKLSRKVLKSNNWIKQKKKISKIQNKIAEQRKDWLHKMAYELAESFDAVIVEDINLRSIGQCKRLAKNVADNGFGIFRNFLKYKLEDRGKQLIKIDKWYPSSKICSNCGNKDENLQLSDRIYKCKNCGLVIDRDYNAALNIKEVGSTLLAW
jgi:putative transposase